MGGASLRSWAPIVAACTGSRPVVTPDLIVLAASGRVNEVLVRLEGFTKAFCRKRVMRVAVRVPAESQHSKGPLDFVLTRASRDAQNFVITGCHERTLEKYGTMLSRTSPRPHSGSPPPLFKINNSGFVEFRDWICQTTTVSALRRENSSIPKSLNFFFIV